MQCDALRDLLLAAGTHSRLVLSSITPTVFMNRRGPAKFHNIAPTPNRAYLVGRSAPEMSRDSRIGGQTIAASPTG